MSAAPARNESRSPSLEYVPCSPSPDAPSFPIAITTETGIPISGLGTPEIIHAPSPQLAPASPLPSSPPPLPVPPRTSHYDHIVHSAQLATEIATETRLNAALHASHTPISPQSVANILQGHSDIPTGDLQSIIMGLINAIDASNEGHRIQVHDLKDQVAGLIQKHYLQPIDPDNIPPSFIENDGCVPVTGTRDRLTCMPVDRGKSWEPAHTFLISSCLILSHLNLISSLVFTAVSLIRVAAPCTLVPPSRLVSCYHSMFLSLLSSSITTCTYCPPL